MPRSSPLPSRSHLAQENARLQARLAELAAGQAALEPYQALFEKAPVAIARSRLDGTLLEVNAALARLFGYGSPAELLAAGVTAPQLYVDPAARARWLAAAQSDAGDSASVELEFRRRDGSAFVGRLTGQIVRAAQGQIDHLRAFIEDATAQRRADEQVRASEATCAAVLYAATDAVYLVDGDEVVLAVNDTGARMTGRPAAEMVGRPLSQLLPAAVLEQRRPYLAEAWAGRPVRFEDERAGRRLDHSVCPVPDADGRVTRLAIFVRDITQRRQAEQAARHTDQMLRSFIEHASDGFSLVDHDGLFREWNPANERLTGLSRAEVLGQPYWDVQARLAPAEFRTPEILDKWRAASQAATRTGQAPFFGQPLERPFVRADGVERCVRQVAFAIPTDSGFWVGATATDVTDRARMEAALRESEARYRLLFEHMGEGFSLHAVITDEHGRVVDFRYVDANPAYERHVGQAPAAVIGRTMLELHPETSPALIERYGQVALDGQPRTWEYFSQLYQRHLRVRAFSPQPGYFATIFEDITEQKRAEAALRESEARYHAVFDHSLNGIVLVAPDGSVILDANPEACRLLGHSLAQLRGLRRADIVDDTDPRLAAALAERASQGSFRGELTYRRADGSLFPADVATTVFAEAQGRELALVSFTDITARRQAEADLEHEKQRYQLLLQTSTDAVHILDRDGHLRDWNPAFLSHLGCTPEQAAHLKVSDWDLRWEAEAIPAQIAELIRTPQLFETRHRRSDGSVRAVEINAVGVRLEGEDLLYASARDVTERRRLRAELQAERDFALSVMNTMGQGLTVTDAEGCFEYVNPAYARLLDSSPEQVLGLSPAAVTADSDHPVLAQARADRQAGKTTTYENRLRRPDGGLVDVLITSAPRWRDGQVRGAIAVVTDLTERKQAERAMAEERVRLRALIAASRDGIVLVGQDQLVYVANEPALRFLGLSGEPDEWEGRPVAEALQSLARQGAPESVFAEARRIRSRDQAASQGEWALGAFVLRWTSQPVRAGQRHLGWLLALRDVTAERQVEHLRDDLTRTMVHDLRGPLGSIRSALEFFALDGAEHLSESRQTMLDLARQGTDSLLDMVTAILDVSRLESGQMPLRCEPLSVRDTISLVVRQQAPLADERRLTLSTEVPPDLPAGYADPDLLRRVLQNLVGNALKFTPAGGTICVKAAVPAGEQRIHVTVRDTGPGLAPEVQGRLFQKFVTGRVPGHGSGLGLAFCRQAVEAHGGRIWAENRPGQGAAFTFTVAIWEPSPDAA